MKHTLISKTNKYIFPNQERCKGRFNRFNKTKSIKASVTIIENIQKLRKFTKNKIRNKYCNNRQTKCR